MRAANRAGKSAPSNLRPVTTVATIAHRSGCILAERPQLRRCTQAWLATV